MSRPALVTLSLASLLVGCHRGAPQTEPAPVPVTLGQARRLQDFETVSVSGTVTTPGASSMVASLVPGRLVQVLPREGEPVRAGQLLAALDTTTLAHAHAAAKAQAEAARAGAARAEAEYLRMKQLFESKSLAPNDFDKFKAAHEAAAQQLQQALAGEGIARKNLADGRLTAPLSGFIARRMAEPGAMVAPGQPLFEIAQLDPVEINVGVPETDIRLVKVGQAASVRLPALPGQTFQGTVSVVNVSADPATRTYMTRIAVPNPKRDLKVGMVAEVAITGTQKRDLLVVPAEIIVRDPQGATQVFQYFPDQKRVYAKRVDVGAAVGRDVQIKAGLKGDEQLVVGGQHGLRNGMAALPTGQR